MLDTKNRLLAFHGVSTGTLSATLVHPRDYIARWSLASAEGASVSACLPGRGVNVQAEPGSTPCLETLRNPWRRRRLGDGPHPRQWLLRYEIRAGPRVGDDRVSQIGSAVAAEIASAAEFGPELLRRVGSAARPAERHRMVRTQREEQRSESDEHQHDARIVVLEAQACQARRRNSSVEDVDSRG